MSYVIEVVIREVTHEPDTPATTYSQRHEPAKKGERVVKEVTRVVSSSHTLARAVWKAKSILDLELPDAQHDMAEDGE